MMNFFKNKNLNISKQLLTVGALFSIFTVTYGDTEKELKTIVTTQNTFHNEEYPHIVNFINDKESIEGMNRGVDSFNKFAAKYVMQPIAVSWATVMPDHGIKCVERFFDNLLYPKRLINSALQADWDASKTESLRFVTNTTIGVVGLYDPAKHWYQVNPRSKDFGQTMAKWGMGEGCYVNIPVLGGTTARDGSGMIVDKFLDPTTYIGLYSPALSVGTGAVKGANSSSHNYYKLDVFNRTFADSYVIGKMFFYAQRNLVINELMQKENFIKIQQDLLKEDLGKLQQSTPDINAENKKFIDVKITNFKSQGAFVDTLRYMQFTNQNDDDSIWNKISPWNSDFGTKFEERSIEIIASRPRLPYILWEQETTSSPMAYIIPGMGSGLKSEQITALAKLLYKKGYSVVALPNTMNWEFVNSTLGNWIPGYLSEDGRMLSRVLNTIEKDLKKSKNLHPATKIMVGLSMGGSQALFLSAMQDTNLLNRNFDRYIAINPAVSFTNSAKELDNINAVWKTVDHETQLPFLSLLAMKYGMVSTKETAPLPLKYKNNNKKVDPKKLSDEQKAALFMEQMYKGPIPFTPREAAAMISINTKQTLVDVLYMIHQHNNNLTSIPVANKDDYKEFYSYAVQWDYEQYMDKVLIPFYQRKYNRKDVKDILVKNSDLQTYSIKLAKTKNVFVFHNVDDFLINDDEKIWIKKTFKGNNMFFSNGGHLGQLNTEIFQLYFNKIVSIY
ncbi:VacJ family lipoprotein [Lentisphaerota bacterium WC36G]|nr:VacJ family lipoprotein [Lentisphaerae bacterium WC36]